MGNVVYELVWCAFLKEGCMQWNGERDGGAHMLFAVHFDGAVPQCDQTFYYAHA